MQRSFCTVVFCHREGRQSVSVFLCRERTHRVYQVYSRKPPAVVHSTLKSLQVDYVIIEDTWCHQRSQEGCSMGEIWDMEDEENSENDQFCEMARQDIPKPFQMAFENDVYLVLRVPQ